MLSTSGRAGVSDALEPAEGREIFKDTDSSRGGRKCHGGHGFHHAFVAEMAQRYSDLVEAQESGKLQNKISKLEEKLAVSESEKAELQRRLQQVKTK